MSHFTTSKVFLLPSFDLEVKEQQKISRFLQFLEDSGVGVVISKYVQNETQKGGRPNCNYYRLFAVICYGFAFDRCTLREIESACKFDFRYITIMEQCQVDYTTISRFINKVIVPNEDEIFSLLCKQLQKETGILFDDAFIDGTKYEANANKYKFVWKPLTFHKRISLKAYDIILSHGLSDSQKTDEYIKSSLIASALSRLKEKKESFDQTDYENTLKALSAMLEKVLEYESKEELCGPNRNSYYKTDKDATAMCLKADYYSGLGSNMHAAYNVQAMVIRGFVFAYHVSQSRADYNDFIPVLDKFHTLYGVFPERVCADAGYGVLANYRYLKRNGIENYVKYQSWEGNVTGRRPDCFHVNDDGTITCLNEKSGYEVKIENRHPKNADAVFFRVEGCNDCNFRPYCKQFMKEQNDDFKIFEVVREFQELKKTARENLLSPKGIEIRVNRSIQVEGVFGIIKQDYRRTRFKRRGLKNVSAEMMLYFLGLNIAKLFRFFETGTLNKYWVAPEGLKTQEVVKPSWKKLSKRGSRVHQKYFAKK